MKITAKSHDRHDYTVKLVWTGARQGPTATYQGYSREFTYSSNGKPELTGSADPIFRGDPALHSPEDQLVAALSSCHLLSYLAECARAGVHVVAYEDEATGVMEIEDGKLRFTSVTLHPRVVITAESDLQKAEALHAPAHADCYIANSVAFPVHHEAIVTLAK